MYAAGISFASGHLQPTGACTGLRNCGMTDAHVTITNQRSPRQPDTAYGYQPSGLVAAAAGRSASLPADRKIRPADRLVVVAVARLVGYPHWRPLSHQHVLAYGLVYGWGDHHPGRWLYH